MRAALAATLAAALLATAALAGGAPRRVMLNTHKDGAEDALAGTAPGDEENLVLVWNEMAEHAAKDGEPVDVYVFLHGNTLSPKTRSGRAQLLAVEQTLKLDLSRRPRATVGCVVAGSLREGKKDGMNRYDFPDFHEADGMHRFLAYAVAKLAAHLGSEKKPAPARFLLGVYSGGGYELSKFVAHYPVDKAPHELHVFDALYWPEWPALSELMAKVAAADADAVRELTDADKVNVHMSTRGHAYRCAYSAGTAAQAKQVQKAIDDALGDQAGKLRAYYRSQAVSESHPVIALTYATAWATDATSKPKLAGQAAQGK